MTRKNHSATLSSTPGSVCPHPFKALRKFAFFIAMTLFFAAELAAYASGSRLLFSDADIAHLKTKDGIEKVRRLAEKPGRNAMEALCLAYRVTGDESYARKAKERLENLIERPVSRFSPEWGGGLNGAQKCYEMAIAYDSLYDYLGETERKDFSNRIVENGIRPMLDVWLHGRTRTTAIDSMGHNWWSACVFLPGMAALAVEREQECVRPWLKRIAEATAEWALYPGSVLNNKPRSFDRDGGFYESVGYANFAMLNFLMFRFAWQRAKPDAPLPEIPFLEKCGDFFLNVSYPSSKRLLSLNFGDSSLRACGNQPILWLRAQGVRNRRQLWLLARTTQTDFKEAISQNSPLGLVFYPTQAELDAAPDEPNLPTLCVYKDMGWAIMRDSWKDDSTMLGIKSGFTWNHAHADAGSFILFHKGENLLVDSGNCWYGKPEYDSYYRQSQAHNVVLFNGEGENPEDAYYGSKFPGAILHAVDAGNLKYVLADATGPVSQNFIRNYRTFLWIDDIILIIDDLKTHRPGRFEWLLHTDGETTRKGLDFIIKKGAASVAVRPLFPERLPEGFAHDAPERVRVETRYGLRDHDEKTKVPYWSIIPPEEARVMKFIVAIILNPERSPKLERLETARAIGVRITKEQGDETEVWLNLQADGRMQHRNSDNLLGEWDTDAYLLAVTKRKGEAKPSRLFIANGSWLRNEEEVVLDSLTKTFAIRDGKELVRHPIAP